MLCYTTFHLEHPLGIPELVTGWVQRVGTGHEKVEFRALGRVSGWIFKINYCDVFPAFTRLSQANTARIA